jgi:putative ABC transport system substrate-binding protein
VKRRALLAAALAAPVAAWAQRGAGKHRVILAFVQGGDLTNRLTSVIRSRLASQGFVEGKNLEVRVISDVCCGDHFAREKARAGLEGRPHGVLVFGTTMARAFQAETKSVPVVFTFVADPVAAGIVQNLARPGGNVTGVSTRHAELTVKRLELVRELLPRAKHVVLFGYFWDPSFRAVEPMLREAARRLGIEFLDVDQMSGSWELPLGRAADAGATAVLCYQPLVGSGQRLTAEALVGFAAKRRMALFVSDREDAELGGLASYGNDAAEIAASGADQLVRVLRGEPPGQIPVNQLSRFELVINLKTAHALGLRIPGAVLARADRVIE